MTKELEGLRDAIWNERCPGIRMTPEDEATYTRAANAAWQSLTANPDQSVVERVKDAIRPHIFEYEDRLDDIARAAIVALEAAPVQEGEERMRIAGEMLANAAFNISHRGHLSEPERKSLKEAQEAWDDARLSRQNTDVSNMGRE